jgi:hypothetical protein
VVPRSNLRSELARRIHGGIDVSPESLLSFGQHTDYILKRRVAHNEQVDVACRAEFTPGGRPKHECDNDLFAECGERAAEHIG